MSSSNKEILFTSGYPRSGNMFLNHCIRGMYFPRYERNGVNHLTTTITNREKTIIAIRKPEESIVSWHLFKHKVRHLSDLDSDINFYIRYYSVVLENIQKCIVMDFEEFIKNPVYIESKIFSGYGIEKESEIDIDQIKSEIKENEPLRHLPGNGYDNLNEVKNQLLSSQKYSECSDLFNSIKNLV